MTRNSRTSRSSNVALGALFLISSSLAWGQNEAAEKDIALIQTYIKQRISAGQDLAKKRTDWKFEKEILQATKQTLQGEVAQIQEQIEQAKKDEQTADTDTKELAKEDVALTKAAETIESALGPLEDRLVKMVVQFPPYLKKNLGADLELLNNKSKRESEGIATRITTVTNILTEAEKANSEIVTVHEERDVNGKTQSVRTVYFGLAMAYSSTEDESVGWIGTPGPTGWTFEENASEAKAIAKVVAIANDEADVSFVPVTAKIID